MNANLRGSHADRAVACLARQAAEFVKIQLGDFLRVESLSNANRKRQFHTIILGFAGKVDHGWLLGITRDAALRRWVVYIGEGTTIMERAAFSILTFPAGAFHVDS